MYAFSDRTRAGRPTVDSKPAEGARIWLVWRSSPDQKNVQSMGYRRGRRVAPLNQGLTYPLQAHFWIGQDCGFAAESGGLGVGWDVQRDRRRGGAWRSAAGRSGSAQPGSSAAVPGCSVATRYRGKPLAGRTFRHYRARGGDRSRVLADFLIGAHAATEAMTLITRHRGYAKHFQVAIEDPTERKVDDDA
jgi:hypothetical protein